MKEEMVEVFLKDVEVNPFQPRKVFLEEDLKELAESIQEVGLLHPPLVRFLEEKKKYQLITGERRFRACQSLQQEKMMVVIKHELIDSSIAALVENIQRTDLNPIEIAKSMDLMMKEKKWTQEKLSEKIGKKRSTVANFLRLLSLPEEIQESLSQNLLSMGHAKLLSPLPLFLQKKLAKKMIQEKRSVRDLEKWIKELEKGKKEQSKEIHLAEIEKKVQEFLGTKVLISGKGKKGKIMIDYFGYEDLERILEKCSFSFDL